MMASFVMGFDGEQSGAGKRLCRFVEELGIPLVMINLLHPLPHTRLWDRLQREGRLLSGKTSGDSFGLELNYLPTRPTAAILLEYLEAIDYLYEPSRYFSRCYRYFLTMRPTRRALGLEDQCRITKSSPPQRSPPNACRSKSGVLSSNFSGTTASGLLTACSSRSNCEVFTDGTRAV